MRPFIAVLNGVANWILRLLRIDPDAAMEEGGTPEDLKLLITQARTGGKLDPGEAGMLAGVFHLHEQEARQVMTPIPAVVTVDVSEDVETALRRCVSSGHTRLVVTEDDEPGPRPRHRPCQLAGAAATWPRARARRSRRSSSPR